MVPPIFPGRGVADIFDEVSEDLRADRARLLLQRYGYLLIIAAVLILVGVGGWKWWQAKQGAERDAVASAYIAAARSANITSEPQTPPPASALGDFERIAASGPAGYRSLARLQAAALKVTAGDLPGALALWDQVAADSAADSELRDLANLLWVQHQVDSGDPSAVQARLAPLIAPNNPWRPLALESQAWLLLRTGDQDGARTILRGLAGDQTIPDGVRSRAGTVLTRLGETVPEGPRG
jgi:hypothetical protein